MKKICGIFCLLLNYYATGTLIISGKGFRADTLPFVSTVKSRNFIFNSMIISKSAVVTSEAAMVGNVKKIEVCIDLHDGDEPTCLSPEAQVLDEAKELLYLIVNLEESVADLVGNEMRRYAGAKLTKCVALSMYHPPIALDIHNKHTICKICVDVDVISCNSTYVGILVKGKTVVRWDEMLAYLKGHSLRKEIGYPESIWKNIILTELVIIIGCLVLYLLWFRWAKRYLFSKIGDVQLATPYK